MCHSNPAFSLSLRQTVTLICVVHCWQDYPNDEFYFFCPVEKKRQRDLYCISAYISILYNRLKYPNLCASMSYRNWNHKTYCWSFFAGCLPIVDLLLDKGCEIGAVCVEGKTALHCATQMGHVDVVKRLFNHGADEFVNIPDLAKWTPLHFAAERGSLTLVTMYIEVRLVAFNIHALFAALSLLSKTKYSTDNNLFKKRLSSIAHLCRFADIPMLIQSCKERPTCFLTNFYFTIIQYTNFLETGCSGITWRLHRQTVYVEQTCCRPALMSQIIGSVDENPCDCSFRLLKHFKQEI